MNLIWILLFCLVIAETTSKSKRIRRTNDKCKREYFEACRCRWNYFHCQNPNKTKLLVWSSFEVSYRGISCKSLCEFCECIEPGTPTINASTITTSTMTMSTGVIYHDEESSALLKTFLGISAGVVMLMVTVNIVCKCRYRMHCIRGRWLTKNKDEYSIEEDQSWLQCSNETTRRRQTNMNTRLKKYSLDDVRCNFEVETYSHQHQLDSSLLNLNDQEDNVSMRCKSANFMEHMDGDIEEDNESRHDLPVNDKVSQDKIQYSYVSGAREKYRSLSIRRFTENTHQTAFGGNSSSPKLTQCKHEIYEGKDQQIVLSHKQLVKECPVSVENVDNVKISIVQPLTGRVQTQNQEYLSSSRLNWDKIFRYLAKNLTASDYKLFFNILYGSCHHLQVGGDRDTGSFIEKVETRVRRDGGDSETLMFELFNQWKQIMGSNVSTEYIEEALKERSNNLLLEKFKEFMRI